MRSAAGDLPLASLPRVILVGILAGCSSEPPVTADPASSSTGATLATALSATATLSATSTTGMPTVPSSPPVPVDPPMVSFPAGAFHQGSAGATNDEFGWQHTEVVPAFDLDVTEVTVEAYQTCVDAGACTYSPRRDKCNLERPRAEYRRDPVNCVTFAEAEKFCAWRGAVLPTDGMWEYAAGGRWGWYWPWEAKPGARQAEPGTTGIRQFALAGTCRERVPKSERHLPGRAQYGDETTCPVGSFPRGDTPNGVKDLVGNVLEWTSTPYCKLHKQECEPNKRTAKGGSYFAANVSVAHRFEILETEWQPTLGFRCARIKKPDPKKGK